ncbi:MAG: UvrD-helicase domain-containing protein [Pseudomonadota bacterium]|nr:UvrD-helicase domain-containing protein [Pseudomonadota bacterium]
MPPQNSLNPRQREAVKHLGSPLLVLAGAGSGKTRVITRKIAWLIEECDFRPGSVFAFTFTNKAAREMRDRVGDLLGQGKTRGLTVSTFHAFGLGFLRSELKAPGLRSGFSVLDAQDSENLLRELVEARQDADTVAAARSAISAWKNTPMSPQDVAGCAEDEITTLHARLYARYQRQLRAYNAVDFDDLVNLPADMLRRDDALRERWQGRVRHLLIDEYQDTNGAQYGLMRLLVGQDNGLTVVGDDDQSIYAWRGARPENLAQLSRDFPTLAVVKLEQNYRSTERILQSANRLIASNPHLFTKRLWSDQGPGGPLRVLPCKDPDHEADRIVSEIIRLRFRHRDNHSDYAVLYRGNHQSRPLERALRESSVPYRVSGGTSFFERAEIKDILAYLRLLANPDDNPAFLRVVNTPRRQIGASTLEKTARYAGDRGISMLNACNEMGLGNSLSEQARLRLSRFAEWVCDFARRAPDRDPSRVAREVVDELGYMDWLRDTSASTAAAESRCANVGELLEWLDRIVRRDPDAATLEGLVSHVVLMDLLDRNDDGKKRDAVQLMTLHAAKGLEFPHVWLAGMEENLLPHHGNLEGTGLEEERRLAYVGITRAQKDLTFTYATTRPRQGERVDCEPSRFLSELPASHLEWERRPASPDSTEAREAGKAHLANLKEMLGM